MSHPLEADLRKADEDRFHAALFAPADKRPALFALYAFHHEIARVAESAREPMMQAIRLQWWREALEGAREGKPRPHRTVTALAGLFAQYDLPPELFEAMIDAREDDAAETTFADLLALERYCDATSGNLMRLASRILGEAHDDLAHLAGVTHALAGLLRAIPFHAARGKVYLPLDFLGDAGTSREEILQTHSGKKLGPAIARIARFAREHLAAGHGIKPGAALPAFLPAATSPLYLKRVTAPDFDAFRTPVEIPLYRRQFAMLRASWRGRL
ncbi:MAG: squalene/phytoene synthase family protein [Proteobacteria bacterium]|nr:squalene/phytoene synthase family protein [Pseudomonadota bacterium]